MTHNNTAEKLSHDIDPFYDQEKVTLSPTASVGLFLRQTRESMGLSIQHVASKIRVRAFYLEALEKDDFNKIPGTLYISGFIKLYARVLELDGEELLRRLNLGTIDAPLPERPVYLSSNLEPSKLTLYISAGLGFLSLVLVYIVFFTGSAPQIDSTPVPIMESKTLPEIPQPQEIINEVAPTTNVPVIESTPAIENVSAKPLENKLVLVAAKDCWLDIRRGEVIVFSKILKEGETLTLDNPEECILNTGNAGGLRLMYQDKEIAPLGKLSEVVRNIQISALLK